MQPRNGTSVLTLSKATAVPFGHNQIEDRAREERSAYPCTLRRVWLKRHSVLLGLPPAPPPTPPPLPLIAAGSGNRAQDQAQGIGRLSSFAHALHARPQSIAETRGVAARARLPPGCPAVRSILLLSKRFCHRSSCGGAEGNWGSLRMQLNAPCQESSHRSNESVLPALRFSRS